ncbi:MAG: hypothetical protein AAFV33_20710 [Chloroflexota bacterium]
MTTKPVNRREFLYYLLGGGVLLAAPATGLLLHQYIKASIDYRNVDGVQLLGEFDIPFPGGDPIHKPGFATSLVEDGLLALSTACTFCEWHIKWLPFNKHFMCPVCGSWFTQEGEYILGPARRDLDRYVVRVDTGAGFIYTADDGSPVPITEAQAIFVDTRFLIEGTPVEFS